MHLPCKLSLLNRIDKAHQLLNKVANNGKYEQVYKCTNMHTLPWSLFLNGKYDTRMHTPTDEYVELSESGDITRQDNVCLKREKNHFFFFDKKMPKYWLEKDYQPEAKKTNVLQSALPFCNQQTQVKLQ